MDHPPKPGWLLTVVGGLVIAQSVLWTAIILAGCLQGDPFAFIAAVPTLPIAAFFGLTQYAALVRRSLAAAQAIAIGLAMMCGFWLFAMVVNVGEAVLDKNIEWRFLVGFVGFFLAIAAPIGIAAWANWRWAKALTAARSAGMTTSRSIFTLRELLGAVTVVAITTGIATFLVRSEPPKFGEHVERSQGPAGLPEGATDVCYHRGPRGCVTYEFTIDEPSFMEWFERGIGTIESESAHVPLKEIEGSATVIRYSAFLGGDDENRCATVTNGLEYDWHKEDCNVHAVFDRSTNRVYYDFNTF